MTQGGEQAWKVFSVRLGCVVVRRAVGRWVVGATVAGYGWDECAPPRSMGNPATCQSEKVVVWRTKCGVRATGIRGGSTGGLVYELGVRWANQWGEKEEVAKKE